MKTPLFNPRGMGAVPFEGGTRFRVWAPNATAVSVVGEFNDWNADAHPMKREDGGMWFAEVSGARRGHQYQFDLVNGDWRERKNDAWAREIHAESTHGVIYADTFQWNSPDTVLVNWNELVLYELHVGNFTAGPHGSPGRFAQVEARLPYLKNLGVNALELMPPMAFPGERSWGYNLTNPFAVEANYGGPDAFKHLVDAAHRLGIAIILDVVYNHLGPDHLDLWRYDGWYENDLGGIYFYNDHRAWTPWGNNRPDYGRGEVREYLRDNMLMWLEEFHIDGLRFDATVFIRNARGYNNHPETDIAEGWTLLQWLNDEVQRIYPGRLTIAEDIQQNAWMTKPTRDGGAGFGTQWDTAFVHPVRNCIVQVNDEDRSMPDIAHALEFRYNADAFQRVIYSESHDEVANGKARIPNSIDPHDAAGYFARKRSTLAAGLVLTTPGIPMLFEGQEFLEDGWFRDDKALDWTKLGTYRGINRLYRDVVHLRRNLFGNTRGLIGPYVHVHHLDDANKIVAFHRWLEGGPKDDVIVVASFTHQAMTENYRIGFPRGGEWVIRFNSDWKGYSEDFDSTGETDGHVVAVKEPYDGCEFSATVEIPPYSLLIFSQEKAAEEAADKVS
jgi:1,4-alpha-glucan branching enzyme